MATTYFEKWVMAKKAPLRPLDEDSARRRHAGREPYIAMIERGRFPLVIVSFAVKWVTVSFLDDHRREVLNYDFKEAEPGRLFMTMAIHREYDGVNGALIVSTKFAFRVDGRMLIEKRDLRTGETENRDATVDIAPNWEQYPAFGDLESICRKEREGDYTCLV